MRLVVAPLLMLLILAHFPMEVTATEPYIFGLLNLKPAGELLSNVLDTSGLAKWIDVHLDPLPEAQTIGSWSYSGNHYYKMNDVLMGILILNMLGRQPSHSKEMEMIIQSYQHEDGGFGLSRRGALDNSTIDGTYVALMMLDALGAKPLQTEAAVRYLRGKQVVNGGYYIPEYGNASMEFTESDLQQTARAVVALRSLEAWPADRQMLEQYVRAYECPAGPGKGLFSIQVAINLQMLQWNLTEFESYYAHFAPNLFVAPATFNGILALKALGLLPKNQDSTATSLRSMQRSDGGLYLNQKYPLEDTYFTVLALNAMGAAPNNPEALRSFVLGLLPQTFDALSFDRDIELLYFEIMVLGALANANPQSLYKPPLPSNITIIFLGAALSATAVGFFVYRIRRKERAHTALASARKKDSKR